MEREYETKVLNRIKKAPLGCLFKKLKLKKFWLRTSSGKLFEENLLKFSVKHPYKFSKHFSNLSSSSSKFFGISLKFCSKFWFVLLRIFLAIPTQSFTIISPEVLKFLHFFKFLLQRSSSVKIESVRVRIIEKWLQNANLALLANETLMLSKLPMLSQLLSFLVSLKFCCKWTCIMTF